MAENKVIDKIRKLLALAGNNPNENEKAQAMEAAQKLLAEYDLSLTDIEQEENKVGYLDTMIHFQQNMSWKAEIVRAACLLYDCFGPMILPYGENRKSGTLGIVGQHNHATVASEIAKWLILVITKEAKKQDFTETHYNFKTGYFDSKYSPQLRESWLLGAAFGVLRNAELIHKRRMNDISKPGAANQLMLVSKHKQQIEEWLVKINPGTHESGNRDFDQNAVNQGAKFGNSIGLERQLNTTPGTRRIEKK